MLLLAVDTSGRQGGISLARGNSDQVEIIESTSIEGGTFSAELIPQISDLLRRHELTPEQLGGLIAVTGPGSFTGLRVGLTAVKGLAEVLKIPIATVTSLELLLAAFGRQKPAMAVLDAGRGEVYAAVQNHAREEMLLTLDEALEMTKTKNLQVIAAEPNLAAKFDDAQLLNYRSTENAARIGYAKLLARETVDVLALDANYIRRSEAEYMQKMKKQIESAHLSNTIAMKALVVRDASASDLPAIVAIQNASPSAAHWSESHYEKDLNQAERLILVAESNESGVLGFLVASVAVKEWELENIAVAPNARRRGIGRALTIALIARARRGNAIEIRQEIRESNTAAQNLGLSIGFAQEGRRRNYYRDPIEDALLFKHLLARP